MAVRSPTSGPEPLHRRLQLAGASNHQSMFGTQAVAAGGSVRRTYDGVVAYRPGTEILVGFPDVPSAEASEFADEVVAFARQHRPLGQVGWWSMDERAVDDLGPRLLARGFHWGWRPNWMGLDLTNLVEDNPEPEGLVVAEIDKDTGRGLGDLPYRPVASDGTAPSLRCFAAFLEDVGVGTVMLHLSGFEGESIGGIYDTAVVAGSRRQGIGTALTVAACRSARELGCQHVLLNATAMGEPVYRRAGFTALGEAGQTWWMPHETLQAPPPPREEVVLVEAIGRGDVSAVRCALRAEPRALERRFSCGLTLGEIAEVTHQHTITRLLTSYKP
ncbi:GNAT family N-acetyltransferase [Actinopolymorpha sp. B11F2]|uniref:GNAT family N-acetyltransferase n=1 Tax=Actinopolymorpha sp. B11F2 TaxID=3160862 RepID=UPI0032E46A3F